MRKLNDWEHENVLFAGYIENWKKHKDNNKGNILLSCVSIRLATEPEIRTFSHIWLHNFSNFEMVEDKLSRLCYVQGSGKVIQYTRKNGTKDYSVNCLSRKLLIEKILEDLSKLILKNSARKKIKDKAQMLKDTLTSFNFISRDISKFDYHKSKEFGERILTKLAKY